jgi:hypothetical protein
MQYQPMKLQLLNPISSLKSISIVLILTLVLLSPFATVSKANTANVASPNGVYFTEEELQFIKNQKESDKKFIKDCSNKKLNFPSIPRPSIDEMITAIKTNPAELITKFKDPLATTKYSKIWFSLFSKYAYLNPTQLAIASKSINLDDLKKIIGVVTYSQPELFNTPVELDTFKCTSYIRILDQSGISSIDDRYSYNALSAGIKTTGAYTFEDFARLMAIDMTLNTSGKQDGVGNKILDDLQKLKFSDDFIDKEQKIGNFYTIILTDKGGKKSFSFKLVSLELTYNFELINYDYTSFKSLVTEFIPAQLSTITATKEQASRIALQTTYYSGASYSFFTQDVNEFLILSSDSLPKEMKNYSLALTNLSTNEMYKKVIQAEISYYLSLLIENAGDETAVSKGYDLLVRTEGNSPKLNNPKSLIATSLDDLVKNGGSSLMVKDSDINNIYDIKESRSNFYNSMNSPIKKISAKPAKEITFKEIYAKILKYGISGISDDGLKTLESKYDLKEEIALYKKSYAKPMPTALLNKSPLATAQVLSSSTDKTGSTSLSITGNSAKTTSNTPSAGALVRTGANTSFVAPIFAFISLFVISSTLYLKSKNNSKL